mgnify:CR=1 FL=1
MISSIGLIISWLCLLNLIILLVSSNKFRIQLLIRLNLLLNFLLFCILEIALFIDDLVPLINGLSCGVSVGDDMISCLLYADDLVLISDTVDGLQNQLNALNNWTNKQIIWWIYNYIYR